MNRGDDGVRPPNNEVGLCGRMHMLGDGEHRLVESCGMHRVEYLVGQEEL